jgi:hypothetical protein
VHSVGIGLADPAVMVTPDVAAVNSVENWMVKPPWLRLVTAAVFPQPPSTWFGGQVKNA